MLTYWYMFLMPLLAAICPWKLQRTAKLFSLGLFGVTVALLIGLRHEIGGDWYMYLDIYHRIQKMNLNDSFFSNLEPGYTLVNWVSAQINFGIYGVNLFCGIVFTYGLILLCKSQPYPWISLGIAMPVLGIVFAMGATRQAAALGIICIAIVSLIKGSQIKYFALIFLAMTFHRSAIVMMPLGIFTGGKNKIRHKIIPTLRPGAKAS